MGVNFVSGNFTGGALCFKGKRVSVRVFPSQEGALRDDTHAFQAEIVLGDPCPVRRADFTVDQEAAFQAFLQGPIERPFIYGDALIVAFRADFVPSALTQIIDGEPDTFEIPVAVAMP